MFYLTKLLIIKMRIKKSIYIYIFFSLKKWVSLGSECTEKAKGYHAVTLTNFSICRLGEKPELMLMKFMVGKPPSTCFHAEGGGWEGRGDNHLGTSEPVGDLLTVPHFHVKVTHSIFCPVVNSCIVTNFDYFVLYFSFKYLTILNWIVIFLVMSN